MNSNQRDAYPVPNLLWSTDLPHPPAGPPLPLGDLLLAPTQEREPTAQHAALHALASADGSARWQHRFEYALVSGLAVATPDLALVAITSTDLLRGAGALVALDTDGEERWRWAPDVQRVSAPAVAGNVVCLTADTRTLVLLDPASGREQGRVGLEESASLAAPALADGVAYVPGRGPHLLAMGLDGDTRWRFDAGDDPAAWLDKTPILAGERILAVLGTGAAMALRAEDGSLDWRVDVGPAGKRLSAPAADSGRLFVGARDGLHALNLSDGREVWRFPTEDRITAAPVVTGGVVHVACHDHHLYALDAASGEELWRREVGRHIEAPPVLAACGDPPRPCVIVADWGGTLTAVARPLDARALAAHARSLEEAACSDEARAAAWAAAAEAFEAEGERDQAALCQEELTRCLKLPIITMDVQHEGLVQNVWTRLQFTVRNEGYGPAHNLVIHASGDEFEGQVMVTRQIIRLGAGDESSDRLDVRPLEYGETVPLRVWVEYEDRGGEPHSHAHTIYIPVADDKETRREGQTINVFVSGGGAAAVGEGAVAAGASGVAVGGDVHGGIARRVQEVHEPHRTAERPRREVTSLRRQLDEARENLRLIEERKSQFVLEVEVPLQLVKEERSLRQRIAELENELLVD